MLILLSWTSSKRPDMVHSQGKENISLSIGLRNLNNLFFSAKNHECDVDMYHYQDQNMDLLMPKSESCQNNDKT